MIKLQVINDTDLRQIMAKLAALIKKHRVGLVALINEPIALSKTGPLPQVIRYAANEITGIQTIMLKHPGQQRCRGRFSMSSGDNQGTLPPNKKFLQQLRKRTVPQLMVQSIFGL